jgi:hypothetical protein
VRDVRGHATDRGQAFGLNELLIARFERGDHALELAAEVADLVVGVGRDAAREVAARDGVDARLQLGQRREHAVRVDGDADADDQRDDAEHDQHTERALLLRRSAFAGRRHAAEHDAPHRAQSAVDRALASA